jgi:tRNA threonylcarbamoyladenosine biosynthesis protein TsaB
LRLLAFDTSGAAISAAAADNNTLLAVRHEPLARGHAERLLPLLVDVLAQSGWTWCDLDMVVVSAGPGNFTGLRAGIAVARSLALALQCPVLGIGTLELLAEAGAAAAPDNRLPLEALLDARRDEVYRQRFTAEIVPLSLPVLEPVTVAAAGGRGDCILIGDAAASVAARRGCDDRVIEAAPDARYLVAAARRRLAGGEVAGSGRLLRPVYLRQPDARMGAGASLLAAQG